VAANKRRSDPPKPLILSPPARLFWGKPLPRDWSAPRFDHGFSTKKFFAILLGIVTKPRALLYGPKWHSIVLANVMIEPMINAPY
jgi:hypothetical protein